MAQRESENDVELLEQWQGGDPKAGNRLVARHFRPIYRFFSHKVPLHAEELTQRTFLACVESKQSYRGDASFRAYLFGIARRVMFAHFKRSGRAIDDATLTQRSIRDMSPSPSRVAAERQRGNQLLTALQAIPLAYQMALELHYWEELTVGEIAEALEVAPGTVKSRLSRGRELLKRKLDRMGAKGLAIGGPPPVAMQPPPAPKPGSGGGEEDAR